MGHFEQFQVAGPEALLGELQFQDLLVDRSSIQVSSGPFTAHWRTPFYLQNAPIPLHLRLPLHRYANAQ